MGRRWSSMGRRGSSMVGQAVRSKQEQP
jgi:hypothetical protein